MRRAAALLMRPAGAPPPTGAPKFLVLSDSGSFLSQIFRSTGSAPTKVWPATSQSGDPAAIARSPSGLSAMGTSYYDAGVVNSSSLLTSGDDFTTATSRTHGLGSRTVRDLIWSNLFNTFIVTASDSSDAIAPLQRTFTDGSAFTTIANPLSAGSYVNQLVESPTLLLMLGSNSGGTGFIRSSVDMVNWTSRYAPGWGVIKGVYGNGRYLAVGVGNLAYSTNGTSWAAGTVPTTYLSSLGFCPINNLFIWSGSTAGFAPWYSTSPDGITWTTRTNPPTGTLNDIRYDVTTNQMVASYSNQILTSPDGIVWTNLYTVTSTDFRRMAIIP